jgi:Zn-dependent M28 family amino/carboxypeptidase
VAERLAAKNDIAWSTLLSQAESERFVPVELSAVVSTTTDISRENITSNNVVGLLEGAHSTTLNEWLIVGAHLDHEGVVGTQTYHGADDNASGVAGVLEVAEAFVSAARAGHRPERSILFTAWNAEELGLLGSWAYTEHPLTPLENTVAVINLDMIGRDEEIPEQGGRRFRGLPTQTAISNHNAVNILGYSRSTDLRQAVERANLTELDVRFRYDDNPSNLLRRSDQWPFLSRGVPALFVHTGLHADYHTSRDVPEKLNYEKMTRIVQLAYQLSWNLANNPDRPALN